MPIERTPAGGVASRLGNALILLRRARQQAKSPDSISNTTKYPALSLATTGSMSRW